MKNRSELRPVLLAVVLYGSLELLVTLISLYTRPPGSLVGVFRSVDTIPSHLFLLALGGVALGLLSGLAFRRLDLGLVLLILSVVVLTDLDHLPSALGIDQPIRPTHSLIFIAVAFVLVATVIRRLDLSFAVMSGFFAHLAVDTGLFPPFSPVSFNYYSLGNYQLVLIALALSSALAAGYLSKRRTITVKY
ncbi:MAG: hypothetical protein OK474_10625 [Thaumarchaeota archaeon]|nr:hypothetical protein [Nitrososphaerota archaeon]